MVGRLAVLMAAPSGDYLADYLVESLVAPTVSQRAVAMVEHLVEMSVDGLDSMKADN